MSSIVVIEPHADDAFISVGQHIENWVKEGHGVFIYTVYPQTEKRSLEAETFASAVGASYIKTRGRLDELLSLSRTQCVLPIGIQHPDHIEVASADTIPHRKPVWRYLDQPYALRQKNAAEVNSKIKEATIVSYIKPSARKWRHIPIFKTQAKFFYFEGEACHNSFELLLKFGK